MTSSEEMVHIDRWYVLLKILDIVTTFLCCCGRGASAEAHPCHVFTFKYFERATLRGGYFPAGRIRTSYRTYTSVGVTSWDLETKCGSCTAVARLYRFAASAPPPDVR
jgi:hypothetical protein